jgi:hypothetical protein
MKQLAVGERRLTKSLPDGAQLPSMERAEREQRVQIEKMRGR